MQEQAKDGDYVLITDCTFPSGTWGNASRTYLVNSITKIVSMGDRLYATITVGDKYITDDLGFYNYKIIKSKLVKLLSND